MDKSPDAFRTISEVAEMLATPAHVLRFWESRFPQIRPVKRAGGRRYYRPADVLLLTGIKKLLHDQGMTIRGVQKILREQGVRHVAALSGTEIPDVLAADSVADLEQALAQSFGYDLDDAPEMAKVEPETATIIALETALRQTPRQTPSLAAKVADAPLPAAVDPIMPDKPAPDSEPLEIEPGAAGSDDFDLNILLPEDMFDVLQGNVSDQPPAHPADDFAEYVSAAVPADQTILTASDAGDGTQSDDFDPVAALSTLVPAPQDRAESSLPSDGLETATTLPNVPLHAVARPLDIARQLRQQTAAGVRLPVTKLAEIQARLGDLHARLQPVDPASSQPLS